MLMINLYDRRNDIFEATKVPRVLWVYRNDTFEVELELKVSNEVVKGLIFNTEQINSSVDLEHLENTEEGSRWLLTLKPMHINLLDMKQHEFSITATRANDTQILLYKGLLNVNNSISSNNLSLHPKLSERAPLTTDIDYLIGGLWVDIVSESIYSLVSKDNDIATWVDLTNKNISELTPEEVKELYELNNDTNAFTDLLKSKVKLILNNGLGNKYLADDGIYKEIDVDYISPELMRLETDKVDKTQKIIGLDLQDDILIGEFRTALGNATQSVAGLLSAEDKTHLDGLVALLENSDGDTIVNTIGEILAIFNNYPEGADLVTALAGKVDKVAGMGLSENDLTDILKSNYDTAYGWGNHATENYLKSITKAMVEAVLTGTITTHDHDGTYEPAFTKSTAFNKDFGTTAGTVAQGNHLHTGVYEPANANIQSHIGSTSNPHGVTKAHVGLGSVLNYDIATQAEAEAGTSNVKYMTPLRTKEAILELSPPTDLSALNAHMASTLNPHNVSKSQVGLGNVDNTSDLDKPISTATQNVLDDKVDKITGKGLSTNDYTTTEKNKLAGIATGAEVNVQSDWNATSGDALILNKPDIPTKVSDLTNDEGYITNYTETDPIFTAWDKSTGISITKSQVSNFSHTHVKEDIVDFAHNHDDRYYTEGETDTLLNAKLNTSLKGSINGLAELDSDGKVPSSQLPSYVDDVLEYTSFSNFPPTGESSKIYISQDTNKTYRWGGSGYIEISASLALGETSSTAGRGDWTKTAHDHTLLTNNPHGVTTTQIGAEPAFSKNTAFNKNFGTTAGTVAQGNDSRFSDARTPLEHTHGNITTDGKIGTTANLVVQTDTDGVLKAKPAGTLSQYLRGDGEWGVPPKNEVFTSVLNGLVPAPYDYGTTKFLRQDRTWVDPTENFYTKTEIDAMFDNLLGGSY